ncbi:MAG: hypothetical protein PHP45_02315 [Elusimicrobiales bacterium]|nr:hypothetical protein [Elusimicrobiales bacterium]
MKKSKRTQPRSIASIPLKSFRNTWANACNTMWVEITAISHLETYLRGQYPFIANNAELSDVIYAPTCVSYRGTRRINRVGNTKNDILKDITKYLNYPVILRVVLLSAAFESYFLEFLDRYLENRPKYFNGGKRTAAGNKIHDDVKKARGPVNRIAKFKELTNAKINSITPHLDALSDVYMIRNVMAHSAGICTVQDVESFKTISPIANEVIHISVQHLVDKLAKPCLEIANSLDGKIIPGDIT